MTLLALPQPGPPRVAEAVAEAVTGAAAALALSLSIWPRERPRMLEPPSRRRSRRVSLAWVSQRSELKPPGSRIMGGKGLGNGRGEEGERETKEF